MLGSGTVCFAYLDGTSAPMGVCAAKGDALEEEVMFRLLVLPDAAAMADADLVDSEEVPGGGHAMPAGMRGGPASTSAVWVW